MDYKELQQRAKELGLRYVGVSAQDLEANIKEAEESPEELNIEEPQVESTETPEDNPDAVVYDGKNKVRTYSYEMHGEDYVDLAEQFISRPDREHMRIEFEKVETRIACPHCGKKFRHN